MYFNSKGQEEVTYDAIVVGTGISGGWVAKELCEKGLKTLVVDRGRDIKHGDYPTANLDDWELPNFNRLTDEELKDYPKQSRTGYTTRPESIHYWVKDTDQPYTETQPFDWIRGYHVGGRSLMWGRQSYRLSPMDFEANEKEGIAVPWPISYDDMAPWYDYVERFAGISGQNEGLAQLPDGQFLPPMELNCVEKDLKSSMAKNFDGRMLTIGRVAHLTKLHMGRGKCQFRNRCIRGCPYGGYFSSNSATLPAAAKTGNMELLPNAIVHKVIYDPKTNKATGIRVMDTETMEEREYFARIIFLNASALNTSWIMMNSTSERFPNGFGNDSGELGHNLMDHHFRCGASGQYEGFEDKYYKGRRPNGFYIPRFRNIDEKSKRSDFIRGYGYQGGASRTGWYRAVAELGIGGAWKDLWKEPGPWRLGMTAFGECLPYHENKVTLNQDVKDKWGMPTLTFDAGWKENEYAMRKDMISSASEMLEAAGFKNVEEYDSGCNPGLGIHEMGTARMGRDPKTSVLNKWNQVHACQNVFVTDGAAMTSAGCQNPSLTYMALSARAADYAVSQLKKLEL